jgi:uncharacterized protein with PQ loop repeat
MYHFQFNNFRHKHCDGMPFVMLAGGTLCSTSWLIYGMLLGDTNIYVSAFLLLFSFNFCFIQSQAPNIPGLVVNALKISVFALYSGGKSKRH